MKCQRGQPLSIIQSTAVECVACGVVGNLARPPVNLPTCGFPSGVHREVYWRKRKREKKKRKKKKTERRRVAIS